MIEVLDQTAGALTVDLSSLTFCDACGIRLLLQLDSEAKRRGRTMVLHDPTPFLKRILGVAVISELLTIEDAGSWTRSLPGGVPT